MRSKTQLLALCAIACSATLAACGGASGGASTTSSADRETARLRFEKCMRDNGVNIQAEPKSSSGASTPSRIERVDDTKLRAAQKACEKFREAAFGNLTAEQRQEFRDAFAKFSACMRREGVDVPAPGERGSRGSGPRAVRMRVTPKMEAAMKACEDNLPNGGRGRGGPGIIGPAPGQ